MHTYTSDGLTVESSQTNPAMALAEIRAKCFARGMKSPTRITQLDSSDAPNRVAPSFGGFVEPFNDRSGARSC